jgi:hypothetical protein
VPTDPTAVGERHTGTSRPLNRKEADGMAAAVTFLMMSWPILMMLGLLAQAGRRHRRREAMVARQVRLTDAIAAELGAVVASRTTR